MLCSCGLLSMIHQRSNTGWEKCLRSGEYGVSTGRMPWEVCGEGYYRIGGRFWRCCK